MKLSLFVLLAVTVAACTIQVAPNPRVEVDPCIEVVISADAEVTNCPEGGAPAPTTQDYGGGSDMPTPRTGGHLQ